MTPLQERRLPALIALATLPDLEGMGMRAPLPRRLRPDWPMRPGEEMFGRRAVRTSDPDAIKRDLATAYVAHLMTDRAAWDDESCVVSHAKAVVERRRA